MYGRFPREEIWRINLGGLLLILWMAPLWMSKVKGKIFTGITVVLLYPFLAGYLFSGGDKGWFMQIMVTGAIVALIANVVNMLAGLLKDQSLVQFLLGWWGNPMPPTKPDAIRFWDF